jgi:malonyl CoA-acyl carrier protein transacylase
VVPLAVSVPFHSRLLAPMVPAFAELVEATAFADPRIPVIDNVTARPLAAAAAVRRSLIEQITRPVHFEETLRFLVDGAAGGVDALPTSPTSGARSREGVGRALAGTKVSRPTNGRGSRQRPFPSIMPIRHFIQCGPGDSLLGFVKRITREATLETFAEAAARLDEMVPAQGGP